MATHEDDGIEASMALSDGRLTNSSETDGTPIDADVRRPCEAVQS
jgi:hypothetical protein